MSRHAPYRAGRFSVTNMKKKKVSYEIRYTQGPNYFQYGFYEIRDRKLFSPKVVFPLTSV